MTDLEKIKAALASMPDELRNTPWRQLDKLPYLHATDDPKASAWESPVVGRFDYLPSMDYIAACHPLAIAALIARLEAAEAKS